MTEIIHGKIKDIAIEQSMKTAFIDYAMSVIMDRSLPDVRDGLKPVHRRVLFSMKELGNTWNSSYKKSARIVGDTIGKYHPHGDQAVYGTLVRMAQTFSMRYVLVDGQGNFGSIDGDSAAAMRYTEARMAKIAGEILADIDKDTVNMRDNYDGSLKEPEVMPTRIPTLLINGTSGIAVGMASNIPPHNIVEIINAVIHLIDDPEATVVDLMQHVSGPDFPTGATILGRTGIRTAYETGRGIIKIRSKARIEQADNSNSRDRIVIDEIPYQVNKSNMIIQIAELVKEKKIEGIHDIRDESDRRGIRVVIELKKDADGNILLNQLYKMTQMQVSFGINMLAICNGVPKTINLRDTINHFILHRKDVVTRRTRYELNEAEKRAHILEGLKRAIDNIDEVIEIIRGSASSDDARNSLMSRFAFSRPQAVSILEMKLSRLTGLERDKIVSEYEELLKKISWYKEILTNDSTLMGVIKAELKEIKEKYGDERKTDIVNYEGDLDMEDLIADEDMVVTLTTENYIKRTPLDLYRKQKRGGKGINAINPKENDYVKDIFVASSHTLLLIFTSYGKVYWTKVYQLPEAGRNSRGKPIINLVNVEKDERVAAILPIKQFVEGCFIMMGTKKGTVKKTDMMEYAIQRTNGKKAIRLNEGDELIEVKITKGDDDVVLATKAGLSIRFNEKDVRPMGRVAAGVRGIRLAKDNEVVTMDVIEPDTTLLSITDKGIGKRTPIDDYRLQSRGGKGIITIKTSAENGNVVGVLKVNETDEAMLITSNGQAIRIPVSGISVIGRNTKGVRLFRVAEGEHVVSITKIVDPEDSSIEAEDAVDQEAPEEDSASE
ncbi:MAG TPA: DNA gyrase subunit A [bacterium]|jgi:DNA gyrase subunit A|nr:DNA gyrase subunit A [bacterium]HNZ52709.1 DNA gyrase subunit A [bacterium]HOG43923.1 DNA gyrase subunit A [bacterium]HPA55951.1 DNA gyrase subunit A [bacterium]HPM45543.1 DNA gyrase subunit A [bacterium]